MILIRRSIMPSVAIATSALALCGLTSQTLAQTFIGGLDGSSVTSTFETNTGSGVALPTDGWTVVSGSAQLLDLGPANNGAITDGTSYANYTIQFDTTIPVQANFQYTLTVQMGYFAGLQGGNSGYSLELGTVVDGLFEGIGTAKTGHVAYAGNINSGIYSGSDTQVITTGTDISGGNLAVRWGQTSSLGQTDGGVTSDFLSVDNVKLSASAVPEPTTISLFASASLIALVANRRRKW
jgi:hypothetical protein